MKITRIGFYGIRNVGPGLVQSVANKGLSAVVMENNSDIYHSALSVIEKNVDYEIEHWGMTTKDKKVLFSRIEHIEKLEDFAKHDIDIIIESVEENLDRKIEAFKDIEKNLQMNIPLIMTAQTNTLSDIIDDSEIAHRTVNIHPVPSVPTYKIVELIKNSRTAESAINIVRYFFEKLDIKAVEMQDGSGIVAPRFLMSIVLESCDMIKDYNLDPEMVDMILKKGLKMNKGPLAMADEIGLDNIKLWIKEMSKVDKDVYKVPKIIESLIEKGHTGVKAKKGFLNYKQV